LHHAAYAGDKDLLVKLLREGADVEAVTVAGSNALHMAAKAGHVCLLSRLINPITLEQHNSQGFTPLQVALLYQQWEAAAVLLAAGAAPYGPAGPPSLECPSDEVPAAALCLTATLADPSPTGLVAQALRWKGYKGRTVLHTAASNGNAKWVKHLLAAGANRDAVDASGSTPMHLAAEYGYAQLVPLLATPSNLNQHRAPSKHTALHTAADSGDLPVLEALLAAGADMKARDRSRFTAVPTTRVCSHAACPYTWQCSRGTPPW
jgi:ankyrin repeat protein